MNIMGYTRRKKTLPVVFCFYIIKQTAKCLTPFGVARVARPVLANPAFTNKNITAVAPPVCTLGLSPTRLNKEGCCFLDNIGRHCTWGGGK